MYSINKLADKPITAQELLQLRERYTALVEHTRQTVESMEEIEEFKPLLTDEAYENTLLSYIERASNFIIRNRVQSMLLEGFLEGELTAIPSIFYPADLVFGLTEETFQDGTLTVNEWLEKRIAIWRITKETQSPTSGENDVQHEG